jgi:N-acetyl-gamma-glutamylphosphate reductase
MEQELGTAVTFVPHLVPLDRGILETIYVKVAAGTTNEQIAGVHRGVRARAISADCTKRALPEIKHVAWTISRHRLAAIRVPTGSSSSRASSMPW